jgi:peptidoglycan/xylan/chitin deacetylase (PgdA/CDA1 family)
VRHPRVAILIYHHLSGHGTSGSRAAQPDRRYTVTAGRFAEQMEALAHHGYTPVPIAALLPGAPPIAVPKPIVVSFDDGYLSDVLIGRRILDRLGWLSEHFITIDWVGKPGFMTWQDLEDLTALGAGVHSHSMSHPYFDTLSISRITIELTASKARLQERLRRDVDVFAVPGGHGASRRVRALARAAGYRGMCTSSIGRNVPGSQPYSLRRIAVTHDMTAADVVRLARGAGLTRMTIVRGGFRAARRALGPTWYDRVRLRLLARADFL